MSFRSHQACGLALAIAVLAVAPARAFERGDDQFPNSIMAPGRSEPWLPPKYKSPPRVRFHAKTYGLQTGHASHSYASAPNLPTVGQPSGPTIVPGLGAVPNLAPAPGVGRETFQDRASRCAQQQGLFGVPNGSSAVYMHTCAMGQ